jgi:hypothetical protein
MQKTIIKTLNICLYLTVCSRNYFTVCLPILKVYNNIISILFDLNALSVGFTVFKVTFKYTFTINKPSSARNVCSYFYLAFVVIAVFKLNRFELPFLKIAETINFFVNRNFLEVARKFFLCFTIMIKFVWLLLRIRIFRLYPCGFDFSSEQVLSRVIK